MGDALRQGIDQIRRTAPRRVAGRLYHGRRQAHRRAEQLLDKHPSVNISPGVLYQYNQQAADDLKKFDERIANVRSGSRPRNSCAPWSSRPPI